MKRLFLMLTMALVSMNLFSATNEGSSSKSSGAKVKEIAVVEKGGCNMGIMIGVPPINYYQGGEHVNSTIPTFSFDANWGIASGFAKTKTFGNNGGVDLGFIYSINHYAGDDSKRGMLQNSILIRAAFHWEFVRNLDVYMCIANGVNIFNSTKSHAHWDFSDCNYAGGIFAGVKYYFTDFFGVKIDFGSDWNDGNISNFGGGVTFKF